MSAYQTALATSPAAMPAQLSGSTDVMQTVLRVLREIRPLQSNGMHYDETTGLTDAGFTSVEMVKVMLGVEGAFDLMIPQDMITPENFLDATAITSMMDRLLHTA